MPAAPARQVAAALLLAVEERGAHVGAWMQGAAARRCAARDRALALELGLGVLRHRSELDFLAEVAARRPIKGLAPVARTALRLGIYQLRYLDRVPAVAAVHESVELAKAAGGRAAGFVNAVLRRAAAAAPQTLEALLAREPDPIRRRDIRLSHPGWLLDRWQRRWGEAAAEAIAIHDNETPVPALRPSAPGTLESQLWEDLTAAGIVLEPGRLLRAARRVAAGDIFHASPLPTGAVAIQDEASQLIPYLLTPEGSARVLDLCAAPGGKAAILAALAASSRLVAVDRSPRRAAGLRARLPAAASVVVADAERPLPFPGGGWDRILVDPPCSGTGTLQRNPEIRWRLQPDDLARFALRQRRILEQALPVLAPGGRLVYSVCSIEPEEGEHIIRAVLAAQPGLQLLPVAAVLEKIETAGQLVAGTAARLSSSGPFLEILPGSFATEGFFAAILTRPVVAARPGSSSAP